MTNVRYFDEQLTKLREAITLSIKKLLRKNGIDPTIGLDIAPLFQNPDTSIQDAICRIYEENHIDLYYEDCVTYESTITKVWIDRRNYVCVDAHFFNIQLEERVILDPSRLVELYNLLIKFFDEFSVKEKIVYDFVLKDDIVLA